MLQALPAMSENNPAEITAQLNSPLAVQSAEN
jgi:hypothetical protein